MRPQSYLPYSLKFITIAALLIAFPLSPFSQSTPPPVTVPPAVQMALGSDLRTDRSLAELAAKLLEAAKAAPSGTVSVTLDKYPTYFTMLCARTKSGGAELHKKFSDMFVVLDGEATEVIGGTIIDKKDDGDEVRGSHIEGGTRHVLHKGDVLTIAPNTPHQILLDANSTISYYVVKVAASTK